MDNSNPGPKRAPKLGPDIKAKIGLQLRGMYGEVVSQGVPERFKAILTQLPDDDEDANMPESQAAEPPKIDRDSKIVGDPEI
jgi:hypothetical protein